MSQILLVSGSLRTGSSNTAALTTLQAVAPDFVITDLYDNLASLPHFNPDDDAQGALLHPAVRDLRTRIRLADGVIFSTPEYAGALPGSFKNLLDWTVGSGELYSKAVAWLNVAGPAAPSSAADAHASLRKVLVYTGALIVEEACARIPLTRQTVGAGGILEDANLQKQFRKALEAFLTRLDPTNPA